MRYDNMKDFMKNYISDFHVPSEISHLIAGFLFVKFESTVDFISNLEQEWNDDKITFLDAIREIEEHPCCDHEIDKALMNLCTAEEGDNERMSFAFNSAFSNVCMSMCKHSHGCSCECGMNLVFYESRQCQNCGTLVPEYESCT